MAEHTLTEGWRDRARKAASICAGAPPHTQSLGRYVLALLDERDDLAARLARVKALHPRVPIRPWADDCADENHVHDPDDFGIADVCFTCPPTGDAVCGRCYDGDGGDPEPWPCPTMAALAAVEPATEEAGR